MVRKFACYLRKYLYAKTSLYDDENKQESAAVHIYIVKQWQRYTNKEHTHQKKRKCGQKTLFQPKCIEWMSFCWYFSHYVVRHCSILLANVCSVRWTPSDYAMMLLKAIQSHMIIVCQTSLKFPYPDTYKFFYRKIFQTDANIHIENHPHKM